MRAWVELYRDWFHSNLLLSAFLMDLDWSEHVKSINCCDSKYNWLHFRNEYAWVVYRYVDDADVFHVNSPWLSL